MDSDVPSECCVCGVPIGVKGGVGGTLQSTSGLWVCFRRKCWKQHEAVFCPGNERLMAIVNRRRDAESDARMAAHLYADALEHAMKADAERDAATARAEKAEQERDKAFGAMRADDARLRAAEIVVWGEATHGCDAPDAMADLILHLRARAEKAEALLRECRDLFLNGPAFATLRARIDALLGEAPGIDDRRGE